MTCSLPSFSFVSVTSTSVVSAKPLTDAAFAQINVGARIVVCGQIDQYNATRPPRGPRLLWHLIVKQARAEGFLVFQFASLLPALEKFSADLKSEEKP